MRKTRTIKEDPFSMKEYLKETTLTDTSDILRTRLHMTKLTCNYEKMLENQLTSCPLCGMQGKQETEHYFSRCKATEYLAKIWNTEAEDLQGPLEHQQRAKNHT